MRLQNFGLNNVDGMSEYELMRRQIVDRNNARLASLGLLGRTSSATPPPSDLPNRKKRAAPQDDVERRVQPKRNAKKTTSYRDFDNHVIYKRTRPIDSSEDTVHKRLREDDAEYSPSSNHEEEDDEDKLKSHDSNDDSTGYDNVDIYGHSQQYYIHQKKYVAFLQELLSDTIRFPSFPKDTDGKVIIDTHPDYSPPSKDEVIGGNKCRETYGNFASHLQKRDPIFYKNGDASSFPFEQMVKSLKSIDPRYSLHTINHSNDILPSQVPFKDENGNDFCTKINLLNKYTSEETLMEYERRVHVIKWVLIDAHH